jgi:anion-transporting  ArsA/GET3 family ATPase
MTLDALLERRLVFLSGEAGVGKSVTGTAVSLAARKRGKTILLVVWSSGHRISLLAVLQSAG